MLENLYSLDNTHDINTPSLVYYKDLIIENTKKAINLAGGVDRLWPHVKSHKMISMVRLQQEMGITKFKCSTIAEAEMLVDGDVEDIALAYPLIGPNIKRFIELQKGANRSRLWAIGDNYQQLKLLSDQSLEAGIRTLVLIDVNMGMNRTGVPFNQVEELYRKSYKLQGIEVDGLHCYDGNHNDKDVVIRKEKVDLTVKEVYKVKKSLEKDGLSCSIIIAGGTPSFPCHAQYEEFYLSPGTVFLTDYGNLRNLPDLNYVPAAALMTRVVSHPKKHIFTIDLGNKGIAADPTGLRGAIVGLENKVSPLFQNEEHWVFQMNEGYEDNLPEIGTVLYVIPTHICPTSALYSEALVSQGGKIVDVWQVTARNRKLTI